MTCTVRFAVGGPCGKPGVYTFKGAGGETFVECAEHFAGVHGAAKPAPVFRIGAHVAIEAHGRTKIGEIVKVGRTILHVKVATYGGKTERVVKVPMREARRV